MIIAISFALALFLSFVLVPLASRYANALGLMDAPDDRKVHSQAIPRAGGIAIVIAFFVPALFWLSDQWTCSSECFLLSAESRKDESVSRCSGSTPAH